MRRWIERATVVLAALTCAVFLAGIPSSAKIRQVPMATLDTLPVQAGEARTELSVVVRAGSGAEARVAEGASVWVYWTPGDRYYLAAAGKSDGAGRAVFDSVPHGVVWVLAELKGHARASTTLVAEADSRQIELTLAPAHPLRVRVEDDRRAPIEEATVLVTAADPLPFGALTQADGAAHFKRLPAAPWSVRAAARGYEARSVEGVTGDVTIQLKPLSTLRVAVKNPEGEAVEGATILVAGSSLWPARRVTTPKRGVALISGLEAGAYDLKAQRGSRVSSTMVGLPLGRGEKKEVVLTLGPGRMVTALVTDGEGEHPLVVPSADVVLAESGITSFPIQGRTDTHGQVTLGPLPPGPATLAARAEGFVARAGVAVPEELEEPVRIPLMRGATLRGEVVDARGFPVDGASIEIVGTDLDGLPVAETPLYTAFRQSHFEWALAGPAPLIPSGELGVMPGPIPPIPGGAARSVALAEQLVDPPDPWVTRFDGKFSASPVTPGRVRALVRHPSFVAALSQPVALAPGGEASVKIVLSEGGTLEGRVLDEHGIPMAGVRVDLTASSGTLERSTMTATDGAFAFAAVPPDVVLSFARPDDLSELVYRKTVAVPEAERVELEITLPAVREPMEIVVQDADERPIEMAQVAVTSLDPEVPLRSTYFADAEGRVSVDDVVGIAVRIVVEVPGLVTADEALKEAPERLVITLPRGVLVEGRVTHTRGRVSAVGATVTLVVAGRRHQAFTDGAGRYRFEGVREGPVVVTVAHPDFAEATLEADVADTGRADRALELPDIELLEPVRVDGVVVDAEGAPVVGARVAVGIAPAYLPLGALPKGMARTGEGGRFELTGLAPGPLRIEAYAPGVGRGSRAVDLEPGDVAELEIRLAPTEEVEEPAALAGVAITLGAQGETEYDVVVVHVAAGSEAERAGLLLGDVVLEVDGVEPTSLEDTRARLGGAEGSDVLVAVARGGNRRTFRVRRERVRR